MFSGHIHQSVILSNTHISKIGEAYVYSTGNTGIDGPKHFLNCYFLLYDTETGECQRLEYKCKPHHFYLRRVFKN